MVIGVYNHLLRKVFRFHYHSQKVIGSLGIYGSYGIYGFIFFTGSPHNSLLGDSPSLWQMWSAEEVDDGGVRPTVCLCKTCKKYISKIYTYLLHYIRKYMYTYIYTYSCRIHIYVYMHLYSGITYICILKKTMYMKVAEGSKMIVNVQIHILCVFKDSQTSVCVYRDTVYDINIHRTKPPTLYAYIYIYIFIHHILYKHRYLHKW